MEDSMCSMTDEFKKHNDYMLSLQSTKTLINETKNVNRAWKETGPTVRMLQLNTRLTQFDASKVAEEAKRREDNNTDDNDNESENTDHSCQNDIEDIFEEGLGVFGDSKVAHGKDGAAFFYSIDDDVRVIDSFSKKGFYVTLANDENMSLFAHYVWNSALVLADYLAEESLASAGKRVLEVGAGAGIPSLMAAVKGAHSVVISDYPEPKVIENLQDNAMRNLPKGLEGQWAVVEHNWGDTVQPLLEAALQDRSDGRFDSIYVADCLWLFYQHRNLLKSLKAALAPTGEAHVIFCNHSGGEEWMGFFDAAESDYQLAVEHIRTIKVEGAWGDMYELDDYSEAKRTIRYFILRHAPGTCPV